MKTAPRRIALTTGGGDAPGLNAVIHAVVTAATRRGWDCLGIRDGYNGILEPGTFEDGGVLRLTPALVRGIAPRGGTILGSTNHGNPFAFLPTRPQRRGNLATGLATGASTGPVAAGDSDAPPPAPEDRSAEVIAWCQRESVDALVAMGGDGSLTIAEGLHRLGLQVVGVPKTIDNDLDRTAVTFGFDTAVAFATECLDRLHSTAESHHRIIVVEVMGRYAGWIALHAGLAGGAHAILLPEIPYDLAPVAARIRERDARGRSYTLVVVAEGARPRDGVRAVLVPAQDGHAERLGGVGEQVARGLGQLTGKEARSVVLGHLLRGGSPTAFDRVAAKRFGTAAVRALEQGLSGVMVALAPPDVVHVPLADVAGRMRKVDLNGDTLATARDLGICLGEG